MFRGDRMYGSYYPCSENLKEVLKLLMERQPLHVGDQEKAKLDKIKEFHAYAGIIPISKKIN